jgi:cytochrome o ubiquinol oxidase subunit 2
MNPAGQIAAGQRDLIITVTVLMLLIIVPIFVLTFWISWKYRATNTKATYQPDWDHNTKLEALWWGIPCIIIGVIAVMAWQTSHTLDPSQALESDKKPMTVQVIALQWKWLFLYPEQRVASVNELVFPSDRSLELQITSAAPMNSFWIPRLGGQIYAMEGMTTKLHLEADKPGIFNGSSANLSGEGFARMNFKARAVSTDSFNGWVEDARQKPGELTLAAFHALSRPAVPDKPLTYASYEHNLYDTVIMRYMAPPAGHPDANGLDRAAKALPVPTKGQAQDHPSHE